ncbi:hypothetical protein [Streptomyces hirsutus]|uniref:hypothetical protein n=1 Tax=Streptomyces hirsutus TaxID=35620 RepID=UPI003688BB4A
MCEAAGGDGSELSTMGTTVAGVVVQPGSLPVFNVGDSQVFAASRSGLRQMSVDDSPRSIPGSAPRPSSPCARAAPPSTVPSVLT